ncbi:hypothetical protein QTH90_11865 [Variovorax sp. J2P1-59]|uniref:hypothetical protein n=1 Tax=Variovorax flavidus TaxID=3053501 RepID=UPI00257775EB|nr:hypothetical protein [Variovorax sp. J2P1-59]MDM0075083.1 hypothetical protein [Variovorax sp. J2P1-59]
MTIPRRALLWPAVALPSSLVGLSLYYLIARPTKDDFFVGPVGLFTGIVLMIDAVIALIGLFGFCYLHFASPTDRRQHWAIAALSITASAAAYGIAMHILSLCYKMVG